MSNNIILIGFMGSGKDVVGQAIVARTGMRFLSIDGYIVLQENKTINRIFKESGESCFRKLEKEAILALKDLKNIVISTGGGIAIDKENRSLLSETGKVVYLDAQLNVIEERLKKDSDRPLIKDRKNIRRIFEERKRNGIYNFADLRIDTSSMTPDEIADEIIQSGYTTRAGIGFTIDKLVVNTQLKEYPVYIGSNFFNNNSKFDKLGNLNTDRAVIVTNPVTGALYLRFIENILKENGIDPIHFIIPDGEKFKTLKTVLRIYDFLLKNHVTRSEPILALGGGVIGDLAGFVASTYKRGIQFIQIPTTLLSQIDASVGGKTGVDHKLGKNMIGTFYQPDMVIADVSMLLSLPEKEFRNGLAEVIKYGIIKDPELFDLLETKRNEILKRNISVLIEIVSKCVQIKGKVVEKDEKEEKGLREILNYGHTIGHIIETVTGYSRYSHGEAVAIGMVEEARRALKHGFLNDINLRRMTELISSYDLPVEIPKDINKNDFRSKILQDKKVKRGKIRLPIPEGIGKIILKEVKCEDFL